MSTRAQKRHPKKLERASNKKKPQVFKSNSPKKMILYNTIPSMPDEFDTVIKTFGKLTSSGIGVSSVQYSVFTNSLLHSSDSWTSGASSNTLPNIGRNYTKYRVVGYKITYSVAGVDTSSYHMLEYHAPVDPAFSGGASFPNEAVTRDKAWYAFIPSSTQYPNVIHHHSSYKMMQVVGEEEFEQDPNYVGAINSSGVPADPVDKTYLLFVFGKVSAATFNGAALPDLVLTLTQYVRFYDKRV